MLEQSHFLIERITFMCIVECVQCCARLQMYYHNPNSRHARAGNLPYMTRWYQGRECIYANNRPIPRIRSCLSKSQTNLHFVLYIFITRRAKITERTCGRSIFTNRIARGMACARRAFVAPIIICAIGINQTHVRRAKHGRGCCGSGQSKWTRRTCVQGMRAPNA